MIELFSSPFDWWSRLPWYLKIILALPVVLLGSIGVAYLHFFRKPSPNLPEGVVDHVAEVKKNWDYQYERALAKTEEQDKQFQKNISAEVLKRQQIVKARAARTQRDKELYGELAEAKSISDIDRVINKRFGKETKD